MSDLEFKVQGSSAEPYTVSFRHSGAQLTAYCTCKAGEKGQWCKHRTAILEGSGEGIVSSNLNQLSTVRHWYAGSDLEAAFNAVRHADAVKDKADADLKKAKQKLDTTARG